MLRDVDFENDLVVGLSDQLNEESIASIVIGTGKKKNKRDIYRFNYESKK